VERNRQNLERKGNIRKETDKMRKEIDKT
jgi:hypothetical protein